MSQKDPALIELTTGQAADVLHVAPGTVSKWFDAPADSPNKLKGFRLPGSEDRRIPLLSLARYIVDHGFSNAHERLVLLVEDQFDVTREELLKALAKAEIPTEGFQRLKAVVLLGMGEQLAAVQERLPKEDDYLIIAVEEPFSAAAKVSQGIVPCCIILQMDRLGWDTSMQLVRWLITQDQLRKTTILCLLPEDRSVAPEIPSFASFTGTVRFASAYGSVPVTNEVESTVKASLQTKAA